MSKFSEEELIMIALILDEEEEINSKKRKRKRTLWVHDLWKKREQEGEFLNLYNGLVDDEQKFYEYFRMTQSSFHILLGKIETKIKKQETHWRKPISARERLAVCLRYLATGDSMKTISFSYRLGLSTVYQIIIEVCYAIIEIIMPEVMPVPTEQKWKEIASEFWTCWNFPNCLGAIDGKHVTIQAPPNSGTQYFCYKKTFSIVLLALVDAHYNFIAVDVGSFGKNSDGGIMAHSKLGKAFDQNKLNVPPKKALPGTTNDVPYVIIGDEAFPLKTYLLRPYPGKQLNCNEKRVYNYRHCRARRVVENAFGLLSQKFRIYNRNRRMQAKPENADVIILSTCVLHNFIKKHDGKLTYVRDNTQTSENHSTPINLTNISVQGGNATREAFDIRETYKQFFNSPCGSIPWQNNV